MTKKQRALKLVKEETGASRLELWGFSEPKGQAPDKAQTDHERLPEYGDYFAKSLRKLRDRSVVHFPGLKDED